MEVEAPSGEMAWRKRRHGRGAADRCGVQGLRRSDLHQLSLYVTGRSSMPLTRNKQEAQTPIDVRHWHVLYTRHQHEKPVARILSSKGHEVFLPLYAVTHRWQDRTKQLCLPLFPCYVFIRGGMDSQLQVISTPGVFTIVGWAGHPATVLDGQIEGIRQMVESTFRIEPYPYLTSGDRVRVRSGTLQGLEGILVRKKNLIKLIISLEMLGRSVAVEIDISCLERLGPSAMPSATRVVTKLADWGQARESDANS